MLCLLSYSRKLLGSGWRQDSNPRPPGPKPGALPLSYSNARPNDGQPAFWQSGNTASTFPRRGPWFPKNAIERRRRVVAESREALLGKNADGE
jgi:hypothetical protein